MQALITKLHGLAMAAVLASAACAGAGDEAASSSSQGTGGPGPASGGSGGAGSGAAGGTSGQASGAGSGGLAASGGTNAADEDAATQDAATQDAATQDAATQDAASTDADPGDGSLGPLPDQTCLDGVTDYVSAGPFDFEVTDIGRVKIWAPLVTEGCKLPVLHFANGTGATCGTYVRALEHLASHGFLTACYQSAQTGQGTQCIDAVEAVYAQYPQLASTKQIGFTGNGTGGGAAYVCAARAEERWGGTKLIASHAVPPDTAGVLGAWPDFYAQVDSPVFIMNGSVGGQPTDGLVSERWVREMYEAFNDSVEAYWYEGVEAAHIPVPFSFIEESSVAWFRWKLLGDAAACAYVKAMPDGERWNLQEQQNVVSCDASQL